MIAGVLLAAGSGRRFGGQKLLRPLADGVPVAIQSTRRLRGAVDRMVAVIRPGEHRLAALLAAEDADVTVCPGADQGMGTSLAWGVRACSDADGWLIALGDMPFIRTRTSRRIAEQLMRGALLVVPTYAGRRGHPVGFARIFGDRLRQLNGDCGARTLLQQYRKQLTLVACSDPGILLDIDVPKDLELLSGYAENCPADYLDNNG